MEEERRKSGMGISSLTLGIISIMSALVYQQEFWPLYLVELVYEK